MIDNPVYALKILIVVIALFSLNLFFKIVLVIRKNLLLNRYGKESMKILWQQNKLLQIILLLIISLDLLIYNFSNSLYKLFYGIILLTSVFLIIHWCFKWIEFKSIDNKNQIDISKKYDVQFKRLAKYLLFLFFFYILYGVLEFREKNNGFYLNRISIANSLETFGYNDTALLLELHELKEQTNDFEFRSLPTKRYSFEFINIRKDEEQSINFKVEGFEFPLKNIGLLIGEELWGDNKKYIDVAISEDALKLSAAVKITGESVKIFEKYFEGYFEKQFCFQNLLREVEYYILEMTDPVMISNYYKAQGLTNKALEVLLNYRDTIINLSNWNIFRSRASLYSDANNNQEAGLLYQKLLNFAPKSPIFLNDMGTIEQRKGNILNAQNYYIKTLEIDSLYLAAYMNRTDYFYYHAHNIDSALFYCIKPLIYNYDNPFEKQDIILSMLRASFLYRLKGDKKNSEYYYIKACNFSPYSFDYVKQPWTLFPFDTMRNYEIKTKQLIKEEGDYIPTMMAFAFYNFTKTSKKEILFRNCLKKYPELIPAQIGLASILFYNYANTNKEFLTNQELYESDSLLKKVLSKQPDNYVVNYLLGAEQAAYGDYILAERYIRKSLDLNKFYEEGFNTLIELLEAQGRSNEVIALCQKNYYTSPFNDICNYKLGNYYYLNKDYQKAEFYLLRSENFAQTMNLKEDSQFELAYSYYYWRHYYPAITYLNKVLTQKNAKAQEVNVLMMLRQCYIQIGDNNKIDGVEKKLKSLNITFDNTRTLIN